MNWSTKWGDGKPVVSDVKPVDVNEWISKQELDNGEAANAAMKEIGVEEVNLYPDYETRTIEVKHNNKKIIVEVTVVGDLALDFDENGWNIYHIPTLACFDKAVPPADGFCNLNPSHINYVESDYTYDKLPLLNWMAKVQQSYPTSWQMLRLLTPQDYEDKGSSAKEIIQKWCLSVKVE